MTQLEPPGSAHDGAPSAFGLAAGGTARLRAPPVAGVSVAAALRIRRTAACVRAGGVVAYPTEAVFGIGCLPDDDEALARVLRIKRRSWRKGMLIVGASIEQIDRWAMLERSPLLDQILASWPGPSTWVLPARPRAPARLTGGRHTIAVRCTAHPIAAELCRQARSALVSTSANTSGRPPLRESVDVRNTLGRVLDDVLPGPVGGRQSPTRILDGLTGQVLRA
ncbi:MAG TPA: Sua5/YciO/YrdC/YwlC family protein [Gammaproteobacteria bacterium]